MDELLKMQAFLVEQLRRWQSPAEINRLTEELTAVAKQIAGAKIKG